jgi:ribosomal protein S12 methylthiotransferase accessory factor YcaO
MVAVTFSNLLSGSHWFLLLQSSITHNVTWEEKSTQNKKEKEIDGLNRRKFEVGTRQIGL